MHITKEELTLKINEFRCYAKSLETYDKATEIMRELAWFISTDERQALENAWREDYVDMDGVKIDKVCDNIISVFKKK